MTTDNKSTNDAAASVAAAIDERTDRLIAQLDALGRNMAPAFCGFATIIDSLENERGAA